MRPTFHLSQIEKECMLTLLFLGTIFHWMYLGHEDLQCINLRRNDLVKHKSKQPFSNELWVVDCHLHITLYSYAINHWLACNSKLHCFGGFIHFAGWAKGPFLSSNCLLWRTVWQQAMHLCSLYAILGGDKINKSHCNFILFWPWCPVINNNSAVHMLMRWWKNLNLSFRWDV